MFTSEAFKCCWSIVFGTYFSATLRSTTAIFHLLYHQSTCVLISQKYSCKDHLLVLSRWQVSPSTLTSETSPHSQPMSQKPHCSSAGALGPMAQQVWSNTDICQRMVELPGLGCARQDSHQSDGPCFSCHFTQLTHRSYFSSEAVFPPTKYLQHISYLKVFPFVIRNCSRHRDLDGSISCSKLKGERYPKWRRRWSLTLQFRALYWLAVRKGIK